MWGAMTSGNNPIIATELQKLAIQKLVGGGNKSLESNPTACLAILSSLLPLSITPGVVPSNALVASHLAVCTHVTEDRTGLLPLYISEPLVSAQAIRHLLSVSSLVHLLDALHLHICAGVVTAGSLGEIISPIFMLMAVAAASNTEPASPPSSATPTPMKKVKHDTNAEPDAGIQPDTSVSTDQLDDPHLFATVSEFVQALGCTSIVQSDDQSTKASQYHTSLLSLE